MKLLDVKDFWVLQRSGEHRKTSHMDDKSMYLKVSQKDVIRDAVRLSPLTTGTSVRRNLKHLSPQQQVSAEMKKSVQRLVKQVKVKVMAAELDGVTMDGSYGSIAALAEVKAFKSKVKAHNAEVLAIQNGVNHLTPGTVLVIGSQVDEVEKIVHLNITTPHMLLHVCRSINSGWPVIISADGLHCLCRNNFSMVSFCAIGLHAESFPLCYSIVPNESISSYGQTWQGLVDAAFYFIKRCKVCDSLTCKMCVELKAVRGHKIFQDFKKTEDYKKSTQFPVSKGICDMIPCFYNFVQEYLDGAQVLNCKAHKIAIPHKQYRFGKHIVGLNRDIMVDRYYIFMERIARNPWPECKPLLFSKMHAFLLAVKQPLAAEKFIRHHTGERKGNWMLCDSGYGGVNHNNSHETHQRNLRRGTQGLIGNKMNSGPYIGMLCKYSTDYSEESYQDLLESPSGLGSFQSKAVPRKLDFDIVQNLHSKTLASIWCKRTGSVINAFHTAMLTVTQDYGNYDIPVYQKIRNAHANNEKLFGTGSLSSCGSMIVASQKLLKRIDPTGDMPLAVFQGHLVTERDNYMKLVPSPDNEARTWDLSTILEVLENFKSLEVLRAGQEWGPHVLTKCSCDSTHLHACCHHSVLMWLLANPEHRIPQQFVGVTMEDRKKRGRRAIPDVDDAEEVGEDGIPKWKAKTVSDSELEDSEMSDRSQAPVASQAKRPLSQPEKGDKSSRSVPDGAGGGAKLRKTRETPKDDLPIYALKRLEGPMLPATETPAAVEDPITEFERQSAVDIIQAYRSATSQNSSTSENREQYVLELLSGSAIPVL